MAPGMDEDRLLAEIERLLAREDPALAQRMVALGRQFPDEPPEHQAEADGKERGSRRGRRDWRRVVALVAMVIAVVGMILTAILMRPPDSAVDQPPPAGMGPAVTLQITGDAP